MSLDAAEQPLTDALCPSQDLQTKDLAQAPSICYFVEGVEFSLPQPGLVSQYLQALIYQEGYALSQLNFVFCSDSYLHQKNLQYLQHDAFTDVITFDYAETAGTIEGEIYISIDRVRENAQVYQHTLMQELYMVMIHGLLHLLGYDDKAATDQALMRQKEASYLMHLVSLLGMC